MVCKKKVRDKSRECHNYKPQPFTKGDCKVQTLALEIITPLNECTGRLSRASKRHKHNRRGMQKKKKKKKKKKKLREKSRGCHNHKPQSFTKGDCKVQTLALEIITQLNECTGKLSRASKRHKHNRRGMQKKIKKR